MEERTPPKEVAQKLARILKRQKPDYHYLKKVFEHIREELQLKGKMAKERRLPELLTDDEMKAFAGQFEKRMTVSTR